MKRNFLIGGILLSAVFGWFLVFDRVSAQKDDESLSERPEAVLLTENFTAAAGGLLTDNGWTIQGTVVTNPLTIVTPGLTYAGYEGSGVGNAVGMTTTGQDAFRPYAPQSSGSVYASVLANISAASVDPAGDYFFHIGADPVGTVFRCRLFVKRDASNSLAFGISKASGTEVTFTPFSYALNTTHLLVVKYTIVAGDTNDTCGLSVNPALGGSEPAATATATDVTAADIVPGSVSLRQGTAATAATLTADGIRVGTAWADIAGAGGGTPSPTPTPSPSPSPSPTATATPSGTPTPLPGALPKRLFTTRMSGAQEVPPVVTPGTGFGRVVLNAAETQITASFYWEGLTGTTTVGHIHTGAAGATGPITFDMTPPTGANRGSVVDKVFTITPAQVATLRAGGMYFNVHSTTNGGGEVRGQILSTTSDAPADFNGDGRTDFSVVRNTTALGGTQARWYTVLNNAAATESQIDFGVISDSITPGDYDGDGKDDLAVWRAATDNSRFFILQSSTNTVRQVRFGIPNDDPFVIGDYDGDGVDDPAIYRPGATPTGQSQFWWFGSFGTTKNVQVVVNWGVGSDTATPGDYNGDGKADFMVYRDVSGRGVAYIHYGTGGFDATSPNDTATRFGLPADTFVPGDWDGDGATDLSVSRFEGASLAWYHLPSSNPTIVRRLAWGRNGPDLEAQGDFDGDGRTDYSVWRTTAGQTAIYYVLRSSDSVVQYQFWGLPGDVLVNQDTHNQ